MNRYPHGKIVHLLFYNHTVDYYILNVNRRAYHPEVICETTCDISLLYLLIPGNVKAQQPKSGDLYYVITQCGVA